MSAILFRRARLSDCADCEKLGRVKELQIADGKTFLPLWYYREFVKRKELFMVAVDQKKIIGFAIGEGITGRGLLAQYFVIDRKYKRQGLGTKFWRVFVATARRAGYKWILGYAVRRSPIGKILKRSGAYFGNATQEFGMNLGWK